jgi:hypothetical protein
MYVAAAPGSQQATGPTAMQFAALKKRVTLLSKSLTALKKDEAKVKKLALDAGVFIVGCYLSQNAGFKGVTQFGDATSSTYGFVYQPTPGVPTTGIRTALDFDASATPQVYLQAVDPTCATSGTVASAGTLAGRMRLLLRAEHAR